MKLTVKLAVASALALAGAQAFATPTVPPPPYNTFTSPTTGNGSVLFSLFSTDTTTPYSYTFNLGLNYNALVPSNGMNTPGLTLTWNLTGLSIPASVVGTTLDWHVTGEATTGSIAQAGSFNLETTADTSVSAATVGTTKSGALSGVANTNNSWISALSSQSASQIAASQPGNPVVSTNSADTFYAQSNYNAQLNNLTWNAGAATGGNSTSTANFFQLISNRGSTSVATTAEYAGIWTLNLLTDTLTYSVAGGAVPLPAGLWLLLSGLTGLGVLGRRKSAGAVAA